MKGLKKDHQRLTDLLFTHLHTMQPNLITLLTALSSQCPYYADDFLSLKFKISSIDIKEKYLLALSSEDSDLLTLMYSVQSQLVPLNKQILTLLSTLPNSSYHYEVSDVTKAIERILERYTTFLKHCDYMTQFNASPYSGADVMVVGFDNYDEEYDAILMALYQFGDILYDWTEGLVKNEMESKGQPFGFFDCDEDEEDDALFVVDGISDVQERPNFGIGVF